MSFSTSRAFFLASTITLGAIAALTATGCDEEADGSGGSGATGSTTSTSTSMTTATGTSSSTGGGGVTAAEFDAYCDARGASCMTFDVALCKSQSACARELLRDEIEKDLLMCAQQGCSAGNCIAVGDTKPLSAIGMEFVTACENYADNCPGVSDSPCNYPVLFSDVALSKALPCFSMGNCPMKESCIQAYADTDVDTCESWL